MHFHGCSTLTRGIRSRQPASARQHWSIAPTSQFSNGAVLTARPGTRRGQRPTQCETESRSSPPDTLETGRKVYRSAQGELKLIRTHGILSSHRALRVEKGDGFADPLLRCLHKLVTWHTCLPLGGLQTVEKQIVFRLVSPCGQSYSKVL